MRANISCEHHALQARRAVLQWLTRHMRHLQQVLNVLRQPLRIPFSWPRSTHFQVAFLQEMGAERPVTIPKMLTSPFLALKARFVMNNKT